jgi:hypothetical protein
LEKDRTITATSRTGETTQQREYRLEKDRTTTATSRETETAQQRRERLEENRIRMTETRQAVMRLNLSQEAFNYDRTYDYESHQNAMIGNMDVVCSHCQAKKFRGESPGICCSNGKVKLPSLNPPPDPLLSYMSRTSEETKHFLHNIRKYNSCFKMTASCQPSKYKDKSITKLDPYFLYPMKHPHIYKFTSWVMKTEKLTSDALTFQGQGVTLF